MLFRKTLLDRIEAGEVRLAFRRWRRPTVKAGGRLRTPVGELAILSVEEVEPGAITDADVQEAGYPDRAALDADLAGRPGGTLTRIRFRLAGGDPREALRAQDSLTSGDLSAIAERLHGMDARAVGGAWTHRTLRLIEAEPGTPASTLAARQGIARDVFKRRVRLLKELGLTESLAEGYRLSPRGRRVLGADTDLGSSRHHSRHPFD